MEKSYKNKAVIQAASLQEWRNWLEENAAVEKGVWLIIYHKESGIASVYYPEAVDEALCFGWIDSLPNKRDEQSYYQYFSKRNPKSNWSRVNKEKVKRLLQEGRMAPPGLQMVELAKESGTWDALNDVENLVLPSDLREELEKNPNAMKYWEAFPNSVKRGILEWVFNAKKRETRQKRINSVVEKAAKNERANFG